MAAASAVSMNIKDHGVYIDEKKKRVQCNYCQKNIANFYRLKYHLGRIKGDVAACENVPVEVMETMIKVVNEKPPITRSKKLNQKKKKSNKKLRKADSPVNLQREKRTRSPTLGDNGEPKKIKSVIEIESSSPNDDLQLVLATNDHQVMNFASISYGRSDLETRIHSEVDINSSSTEAQRCIARFFYENGIDISAATSTSFERMINSVVAHPQIVRSLPSCEDLRGRIFQKELEDMNNYVWEIRDSWPDTGCSILLDAWVNENGHHLMNILVDCPKGPIYLRSCDISAYVGDDIAMYLLINDIVEEVGQSNVVQIITDSMETSSLLDGGKLSVSMHKTVFWSLSATYCLELILKEIAEMDHVQETLTQAKTITRFFHRDADIFRLMKDHIHGCPDLVSTSKFKFAKPFLTLENLLSEKKNLERMIESSEWVSSTTSGKEAVAILVGHPLFWYDIEMVLKATKPIVNVLYFINSGAKPQIGYIYEKMDEAKEKISKALKYEDEYQSTRKQYWDLIDKVWDNFLHSPLHAAAYHLTPSLYCSRDDSRIDYEVESGFLYTVARMVQDQRIQNQIYEFDLDYQTSSGAFEQANAIARSTRVSPAKWWSCHGEQCPQLQKFAIQILSQTCAGASKYGLKRSLAEKLLKAGSENRVEQRRLSEQAFVHYNLQLHTFNAAGDGRVTITEEVDPMDDWVVENHSHPIEQQLMSEQAYVPYNPQLHNLNADGDGSVIIIEDDDPMDVWIVENLSPDRY